MSIAKLSLVTVMGDINYLDDVIIRCLESGGFHAEPSVQASEGIRGFAPVTEENPYAGFLTKVTNLGVSAGLNPRYLPGNGEDSKLAPLTDHESRYYEDFLSDFEKTLSGLHERRNFLQGEIDQDEGALVFLTHLAKLDVDFDELFSCNYTKVRFGRMPLESCDKLIYYRQKPFIFAPFDVEKEYRWGAYFALTDDMPEIDDVFSSLYFERIRSPKFFHGTPEEALGSIREELARIRTELAETEKQLAQLVAEKRTLYYQIYTRIKFLSDSFEMRKYVSVLKRRYIDVFYITGFIETKDAKAFADRLMQIGDVTAEVRPHDSDKRLTAPTKLKNGWFSSPFEMFVEMYGLPAYGDPDPTLFVAMTYCLLFGVMFGDLGQGLLLVLGGELLWRWKHMNLGRVINRIGIFSCFFGTLYGSFFGFEDALTPFFVQVLGMRGKPIEVMAPENTNLILLTAVGLGVVLICTSILIDIYIGFRRHDYERALFSANGVAGLVFYGAVLFGGVMLFLTGKNLFGVTYVVGLLLLPLAVILFKEPLGKLARGMTLKEAQPEDGMGNYLTEGAFELFEVVLSFFSNTMSFLRVGGFVLSHAGMMAVVFTLSEMVGAAASPVVIVLGNLFVMAMEGLIVGIQVLRLEYYELFSRYFDGDGKAFHAVSVSNAEQ